MSDSYSIETKDDSKVKIQINLDNTPIEQVMKNINSCKNGSCQCKTDEYQKLESLDYTTSSNQLDIHLKPKEGQEFDLKEIEKCVVESLEGNRLD